jgi:transposase
MKYYAGLDIHKKTCQTIICTEKGDIVKKGKITTEPEKIKEFFQEFKELTIAIEACNTWEHIFEILESEGHKVVLAHPLKTRIIAESRVKTDKIDAEILMQLLRTGFLPVSYIPNKEIRNLRNIVRQRIFLGRYTTRLKNKIYAELLRNGIKYKRGPTLFKGKGLRWLNNLKIPSVETYLNLYKSAKEEIQKIEQYLKKQGKQNKEAQLLTTIPGVGIYSALIILSEIGDIHRFPNEEKLFSYAGVIPTVHQTGENTYHGHITKQGSKHLRWILTEAVRIHLIWTDRHMMETKISKFYQRICKKKPKNVAATATTRKMLQIIYHMLKRKDEFRG